MEVFQSLQAAGIAKERRPLWLTIGNFDGVHLGHRSLLNLLTARARDQDCDTAVLTFSNHPREVLGSKTQVCKLCSVEHRLKLLKEAGVDVCFLLEFTAEFSKQSAADFLAQISETLPLAGLLLGHDAVLGHDRGGDPIVVNRLAELHGFSLDYVEAEAVGGQIVSSSVLRQLVQNGELNSAKEMLGRPYSVYGVVGQGSGLGRQLGFPTINLTLGGLCLPQMGVYSVRVLCDDHVIEGIGNLGYAPTLQDRSEPVLEAFLFDWDKDLYGKSVEIQLLSFVRAEQRFSGPDELLAQIRRDIEALK